jgi:GNAT superfamily N-acetyltransferase
MKLQFPTSEQLEVVYRRDLRTSFPPSELKPLRLIRRHMQAGRYRPWCLFDGGEIMGECFLWVGAEPGWALLDYLCVRSGRRNQGLGSALLEKLRDAEPGVVILGETETPEVAPDGEVARRRRNFYRRNGAWFPGLRTEIFGVRYDLMCWPEKSPDTVLAHYDALYRTCFSPEQAVRYLQIPWRPGMPALAESDWRE